MDNPVFIKKMLLMATVSFCAVLLHSCSEEADEPDVPTGPYNQTVLIYMPWSGSGIYDYFQENINAFERAIVNNRGLGGNGLMLFISTGTSNSYLVNISYRSGACRRDTLKRYTFSSCDYTTASGITSIIRDVMSYAPASTYAMAIGSHGMGWVPAGTDVSTRISARAAQGGNFYPTRFFGHSTNINYQTDITTLAEGIINSGIKMEYVLFDDCYMSNVEVAYDMRNAANHLIASTCEVMIDGMPYESIGIDLLTNDYEDVCTGFYEYYSVFPMPCGTIAVTDCREVEAMADIMRKINAAYPDGLANTGTVQDLDGYYSTIFFDFGDYVSQLCTDEALLSEFNDQLNRLVLYKQHTPYYYSVYTSMQHSIDKFSGLTISEPTKNSSIINEVKQTNWYLATH